MINTSAAFPALIQGVRTLNAALLNNSSSPGNTLMAQAPNPIANRNQRAYRGRNPSDDRCYICNEPGHYANQCWQAPNRSPNQQQQVPLAQKRQSQEVRTILAPPTHNNLDIPHEETKSRMLIEVDQDLITPLLSAPALKKGGGIRKTRAGKNKVRIDRDWLRAMLDDGEADPNELMDTIEEIYDSRPRLVGEEKQSQPIDNNLLLE